MKNVKLIIFIFVLFIIGVYPARASDTYTVDSDFTVYIGATDTTTVYTLPPLRYVPNVTKVTSNYLNVTVGNATYEFKHSVDVTSGNPYNNYTVYSTKISGGNNAGQIVSYTQEFTYLNSDEDMYQLSFYISQRRAGSGTITLQAYNDGWVTIETLDFNGNYTSGNILPNANVKGWKYIVNYTLNNPWTLLRYDDMYTDGYVLNDFYMTIKNSQQQSEELQNKIEENTRNTNTILGTIKNTIDNIVTAIANLPTTILNGLKELFIPEDFTSLLTDNVSELTDTLGFLGFPLAFLNDLVTTIVDSDGLVLSVSVPSIGSPWGTLYPGYTNSNILYWTNYSCFSNLGNSVMFSSLLSLFGLNYNSSIVSVIHAFTNLALFLALLKFAVSKYNDIFGTDLDVGGDDD